MLQFYSVWLRKSSLKKSSIAVPTDVLAALLKLTARIGDWGERRPKEDCLSSFLSCLCSSEDSDAEIEWSRIPVWILRFFFSMRTLKDIIQSFSLSFLLSSASYLASLSTSKLLSVSLSLYGVNLFSEDLAELAAEKHFLTLMPKGTTDLLKYKPMLIWWGEAILFLTFMLYLESSGLWNSAIDYDSTIDAKDLRGLRKWFAGF